MSVRNGMIKMKNIINKCKNYVGKARQKLNDTVREYGNKMLDTRYGGLGDILTTDVDKRLPATLALGLAVGSAGCGTVEAKTYDGSAMNLFDKYKATQNVTADELKKMGYSNIDQFVKDFRKYQSEGDADSDLTKKTSTSDKNRNQANVEYAQSYLDLCKSLGVKPTPLEGDNTDGGDGDDPFAKKVPTSNRGFKLPSDELYFHIGPFLEKRDPYDTSVDDVSPYTLTGFKLDLGLDKTFGGYFTAFGGSHSDVDLDNVNNGAGVSDIESTLTTFGIGGGMNLFSNPYFRLGLEGGLLRNWESIDGTFTDNLGNITDINAGGYADGLFLGAKVTWKPLDWMALTFGVNNTWFAKDQSDNTRKEWARNFALTFGGKF